MSHANAALTPRARLKLARLIVDNHWPIARAAERYDVSWPTAKRWADRYRQAGEAGMCDRYSRHHSQPNRTSQLHRRLSSCAVETWEQPCRVNSHVREGVKYLSTPLPWQLQFREEVGRLAQLPDRAVGPDAVAAGRRLSGPIPAPLFETKKWLLRRLAQVANARQDGLLRNHS